jgi:chloride channel protein, CIC family
MTVAEADTRARLDAASQKGPHAWPVLGTEGICGVVSTAQLQRLLAGGKGDVPLGTVLDCTIFPHLHRDHACDLALERVGKSGLDMLPVVSRFNVRELQSVVELSDILAAYHIKAPALESVPKPLP